MSGSGAPHDAGRRRARRGRLLIIGAVPMAAGAEAALHPAPARAENLFEAIGELAASDARHPIVAALVADSARPGPRLLVAEALKRIDPGVRVIRIADVPNGPDLTGSDATIAGPVTAAALTALLGDEALPPDAPAAPTSEAPPVASSPPPATAPPPPLPRAAAAPTAPPAPEPDTAPARGPSPPAPWPPEPMSTPASGPRPEPIAGALGDVDLVDALMFDPTGVRETALRLVREQTGWDDLVAVPAADGPAPARTAQVPVPGAGAPPLVLRTARAAAREVEPWAQWLARWLALDAAHRDYRMMAFRDDLTGAWNRRYFHRFLTDTMAAAAQVRRPVTVMVFDIDDFKRYNDEFSHEAGDVILKETVALLHSVIRACDRVCRIGGDEFAVIFADLEAPRTSGSRPPESVEAIARRFQEQICRMRFPKLGLQAPGTLSISAGLATFPWDGHDAAALLRLADERALESKRRGKNHITFGPGGMRGDACDDGD